MEAHPLTHLEDANVTLQTALYESMGWWDDPNLDLFQTNRTTIEQGASTVLGLSIRQKLPFWSSKQRNRPAQFSVAKASKYEALKQRRLVEDEIIFKIYSYARAKEEQEYLQTHRSKLNHLKNALLRTKSASPSQSVERNLILLNYGLIESQFDTMEFELAKRATELLELGLDEQTLKKIKAKWIKPTEFENFASEKNLSSLQMSPEIENKRQMLLASSLQRDALSPRPEFDIFAQNDEQHGGSRERNLMLGLGVRLPLSALGNHQSKMGEAGVLKSRAELEIVERSQARQIKALEIELNLVRKLLQKFNLEKIKDLELMFETAERDTRRGWVTVSQLLELQRQIQSQIEAYYDVQIRTITLIKQTCNIYDCNARKYLGGTL